MKHAAHINTVPNVISHINKHEFIAENIENTRSFNLDRALDSYLSIQQCINVDKLSIFNKINLSVESRFETCVKNISGHLLELGMSSDKMNQLKAIFNRCFTEQSISKNFLCHGDLHPGNIILNTSGCYIVDWEDIMLGPEFFGVSSIFVSFYEFSRFVHNVFSKKKARRILETEISYLILSNCMLLNDFCRFGLIHKLNRLQKRTIQNLDLTIILYTETVEEAVQIHAPS